MLNETKALTMSVVTNIVVFARSASLNRYVMYFNIEFPQKNLNNKMQQTPKLDNYSVVSEKLISHLLKDDLLYKSKSFNDGDTAQRIFIKESVLKTIATLLTCV